MEPKTAARTRLDAERSQLIALSHRIHAHPEVGFEEERASTWLAETLTDAGFAVTRGICDLPTAFMASTGSGPLHLAICAEYDCLPGIGHACGHNIIAAMAAGAGIAVAEVANDVGITVHIIGTPAEEMGGGGKILLLERGAFAGMHAAMMVHPSPTDNVTPVSLANSYFEVRYTGKEAHAAAFPERGINAADALTIAQVALGLLRQHIRATDRVHGIITKGGDAPQHHPGPHGRQVCRARPDGRRPSRRSGRRCCVASRLGQSRLAPLWRLLGSATPMPSCVTILTSPRRIVEMPRPWGVSSQILRHRHVPVARPTWVMCRSPYRLSIR